jgi:hypothetical protein
MVTTQKTILAAESSKMAKSKAPRIPFDAIRSSGAPSRAVSNQLTGIHTTPVATPTVRELRREILWRQSIHQRRAPDKAADKVRGSGSIHA